MNLETRRRIQAGFTITELLIAAAIMGVILLLVAQGLAGSGREVTKIASLSEVTEDTRSAGALIADNIAKAVYMYVPGTTVTLGVPATGFPYKSAVPTTLTVGAASQVPIIAYLETAPDATPGLACGTTAPASVNACLSFVAYFPVLRSTLTASAGTSASNPGVDAANDATSWTLLEYRAVTTLDRSDLNRLATVKTVPTSFIATSLRMVTDYLVPNTGTDGGFRVSFQRCQQPRDANSATDMSLIVQSCASTTTSLNYRTTVSTGRFILKATINRGSSFTSQEFSFPIAPRNLYQYE